MWARASTLHLVTLSALISPRSPPCDAHYSLRNKIKREGVTNLPKAATYKGKSFEVNGFKLLSLYFKTM